MKTINNFICETSISTVASEDVTIVNPDELNAVIRSILITRARDGATIQEIKNDYYNITGDNFPINDNITDYLLSIPNVTCFVNENCCRIFNISMSEKGQHIIDMIKEQKPPRSLNSNNHHHNHHHPHQQQTNQQINQVDTNSKISKPPASVITTNHHSSSQQSQYHNNLDYFQQNFIRQSNNHPSPQPQQPPSAPSKKNINNCINKYSKIRNFNDEYQRQQYQQYKNNYYDNNNFPMRKLSTKLRNSNNNFYNQNQFNQQYQQPQPHHQIYSTINKQQQQQKRLPHRSTPINENYNYEMEINDIADYISRNNNMNDDNLCFFEDNYKYLYNKIAGSSETLMTKPTLSHRDSSNTSNQESEIMRNFNNPFQNKFQFNAINKQNNQLNFNDIAHIHDYQLLGDDFFLALARVEIGCKYKKGNVRRQSGLCVSGQTIQEAAFRILNEETLNKKIIVNIGSVDILQEHHLIDIQQDFLQLLLAFEKRNILPILTTLAPLANSGHKPEIKKNLECFNDFIRKCGLPYIDIWTTMVNQHGKTYYDCYQCGAKYVSGSIYPHVFWNNIGRQRILNKIKSELAFI